MQRKDWGFGMGQLCVGRRDWWLWNGTAACGGGETGLLSVLVKYATFSLMPGWRVPDTAWFMRSRARLKWPENQEPQRHVMSHDLRRLTYVSPRAH